jgi:hypothetical protein
MAKLVIVLARFADHCKMSPQNCQKINKNGQLPKMAKNRS